jgi:opacity protein-like surface antigen
MLKRHGLTFWVLVFLLAPQLPAAAQEDNFKLGGGAGFAWPKDPVYKLNRAFDVGGFFGIRFNDNFSVEAGFSWAQSERQYADDNRPIDTVEDPTVFPVVNLQTTRYTLDAILVYNLGRRQPFHPFIFVGGGVFREDQLFTDLSALIPEDPANPPDPEEIELETWTETNYYPALSLGIGFDFYILNNVAARGEWRWWLTEDWDRRSMRLFFAATLFF